MHSIAAPAWEDQRKWRWYGRSFKFSFGFRTGTSQLPAAILTGVHCRTGRREHQHDGFHIKVVWFFTGKDDHEFTENQLTSSSSNSGNFDTRYNAVVNQCRHHRRSRASRSGIGDHCTCLS